MKPSAARLALALVVLPLLATGAQARTLQTSVGQKVAVTELRSPCEGGPAPGLALLAQWLVKPLRYGALEVGPAYRKRSQKCPGKTLWMRLMYYRGNARGSDTISIDWPDAGVVSWKVKVK